MSFLGVYACPSVSTLFTHMVTTFTQTPSSPCGSVVCFQSRGWLAIPWLAFNPVTLKPEPISVSARALRPFYFFPSNTGSTNLFLQYGRCPSPTCRYSTVHPKVQYSFSFTGQPSFQLRDSPIDRQSSDSRMMSFS